KRGSSSLGNVWSSTRRTGPSNRPPRRRAEATTLGSDRVERTHPARGRSRHPRLAQIEVSRTRRHRLMASTTARQAHQTSGWAVGLAAFAGYMLIIVGFFQAFEGLAAIIRDSAYVATPNYVYEIDTTAWGWIHLIWGAVVCVAGFGVLGGRLWGRIVGIVAASLSAIANFFYIPYYPIWAILTIALDVAIIWALCVYRRRDAEAMY